MTTNILPFRSGVPQSDGFQSINVGVFKVMEAATRTVRRRALPSARSVELESAYLNIRPLSVPTKSATGAVESHQLDVELDVEEAARQIWPQIEVALRTNLDPVCGKPCRLGQGQERGRQSRPCVGFSAVSVVAQCTGE
jgi:hypothetical protein